MLRALGLPFHSAERFEIHLLETGHRLPLALFTLGLSSAVKTTVPSAVLSQKARLTPIRCRQGARLATAQHQAGRAPLPHPTCPQGA